MCLSSGRGIPCFGITFGTLPRPEPQNGKKNVKKKKELKKEKVQAELMRCVKPPPVYRTLRGGSDGMTS